jgi:hypothetical protein
MLKSITDTIELFAKKSVEDDQWDEIPMLVVVTGKPDDEQHYILALAFDGTPYEQIKHIAVGVLAEQLPFKGADVTGLLLCNEGWGLDSKKVSETGADLGDHVAELRSQGKGFADSPFAIETKNYFAVDEESVCFRVLQRGDKELLPMPENGEVGGDILMSLRKLYEVCHMTIEELEARHPE